jgi:hypothetical protein
MEDVRGKFVQADADPSSNLQQPLKTFQYRELSRANSASSSVGPASVVGPLVEAPSFQAAADITVLPGECQGTAEMQTTQLVHRGKETTGSGPWLLLI